MELTIVNPQPKYSGVGLIEPPPTGYLHLAAVASPTLGRTPFVRSTARRTALLSRLTSSAAELEQSQDVVKATVYRAVLVPPLNPEARRMATRPARYDVVVLVETISPGVLDHVRESPPYQQLLAALSESATDVHQMDARCVRRIADVDKTRPGLFLFNYFVAEDPDVALELWDHLAVWYAVETGMDNSTLLVPTGDADYTMVNHARWDHSLARFMVDQFAKKSFRSYVLANLRANHTASMPILYRLA